MDFPTWLDAERGRASRVAAHFKVSISAVTQWRDKVPPDRMLALRQLTGGEVTLEEMLGSFGPSRALAAAAQSPLPPPAEHATAHVERRTHERRDGQRRADDRRVEQRRDGDRRKTDRRDGPRLERCRA